MTAVWQGFLNAFSLDAHPVRLFFLSVAMLVILFGLTEAYLRWHDARRAYLPEVPLSKASQPRSFNTPAVKGFHRPTAKQFDRRRTKGGRDAA